MSLFSETADNLVDAIDSAEHIAHPRDFVAGALTPLRLAAQGLFEDWLTQERVVYNEVGGYHSSRSALLRNAKQRAEFLGVEWRHEDELVEQEEIDAP